jgi:prephenate dehydrogenase
MAVVTVIGGAGRMGAWFAVFLRKKGYRIIISDNNTHLGKKFARDKGFRFLEDWEQAVQAAQIVVLATPTEVTKRILSRIEPHLSRNCLLVEISSIKAPVKEILQTLRRHGVTVLSVHPMFGPAVKSLTGKTIITTMLPRGNVASKFLSLFRKEGVRVVQTDFDKHDELASITLTAPHFMNIALVNALRFSGFGLKELREVAGTTFTLQLLVAEAVYRENFGNEISILMDNEGSLQTLKTFVKRSNETLSLLSKGKRSDLLKELRMGRRYLQKDLIFHKVQERFNAAVETSTPH